MKIKNHNRIISTTDFDIVYKEQVLLKEDVAQTAELNIKHNNTSINILFELTLGNEIIEDDFLYVPETGILFYSGSLEWCAFDLVQKSVIRTERAEQLPYFERRNQIILIYDEGYVASTDLKAQRIDKVPIDPPTTSRDYEDRIEFDSPIFGKQVLKLHK